VSRVHTPVHERFILFARHFIWCSAPARTSRSTSNERYASSSVPSSRPRRRHLSRCSQPLSPGSDARSVPHGDNTARSTPHNDNIAPSHAPLELDESREMAPRSHRDVILLRRPFTPFRVSFRMNDALSGCETSRRRSVALALGCLSWWCIVRGCFCVYSTTIFTYGYELNRRARARSCAPCTTS